MKPVVVSRPEVESQREFISQELSNRYVGQGEVFRDLCHFGMSFAAKNFFASSHIWHLVVPYCYLFLLSVFILWFSYYVSDIFCKFMVAE